MDRGESEPPARNESLGRGEQEKGQGAKESERGGAREKGSEGEEAEGWGSGGAAGRAGGQPSSTSQSFVLRRGSEITEERSLAARSGLAGLDVV